MPEIEEWRAFAGRSDELKAALHVDTGLNRLGLRCEEAIEAKASGALDGFEPSLLISHFVSSEEPDDPINAAQIARFLAVQDALQVETVSLCNSSGFFLEAKPYMNLARPGFALYGGNPTPGLPNPMHAVVTLEARIIQLRDVPDGETVGYNSTWTAHGPRRIAVLSVGYADGITRQLAATDKGQGGIAFIAGVECPIAGRVSMDLITIDVTHVPRNSVKRGDHAELLGPHIGVDDVGRRGNTNGYEILTSLGRRYHRHYVNG